MELRYTAKSLEGRLTNGVLDTASFGEAQQTLREQGLFPLSFQKNNPRTAARFTFGGKGRSGIKRTELMILTSQLAIMCQSGIDLAEAIRSTAEDCRNPRLRKLLEELFRDISAGSPVSVAMKQRVDVFGEAYVASIAAAESAGTVNEVLSRLAEQIRNEIRLRSTLWSTLAYPLVLISIATVVVNALVFFVLPQFGKVFVSLGRPAPPMTQLLLDTAQILRAHSLLLLAGLVATMLALWRVRHTEQATRCWDRAILNLPLLRDASRLLLAGRMFRLIGTMLQTGVPLLESVRLCRSAVKNQFFRKVFDTMEREVLNGNGIGKTIGEAAFIPAGAAQMIATAEKTGKLGMVMQLIGEYYEDDGERRVRQLVRLLEPVIIVVMGVFVAIVVLAVIVPLLDVSTMSH